MLLEGRQKWRMQRESFLLFKEKPRDCFWVTFIQQLVNYTYFRVSHWETWWCFSCTLFICCWTYFGNKFANTGWNWAMVIYGSYQCHKGSKECLLPLCRARTVCNFILCVYLFIVGRVDMRGARERERIPNQLHIWSPMQPSVGL